MNAEKSFTKVVRILLWMVVALLFAVIGTGGCAYNRATEDGALARFGINLELLPSSSSDDRVALSNKAIETTENSNATNAHDSGIRKTIARTNVVTTTTIGPSREHIRN